MWQWDSEPILRHQRTLSKLALLVRSNILPEDDLFMVSVGYTPVSTKHVAKEPQQLGIL